MPRFSSHPILATTLSLLSSRAQPRDLRCAIRVPRSYRPTTLYQSSLNPHENTNLPFVIPGFQEWSAELQIRSLRLGMTRTAVHKERLLNRRILKSNLVNYLPGCTLS